jgi:hypothetical protein
MAMQNSVTGTQGHVHEGRERVHVEGTPEKYTASTLSEERQRTLRGDRGMLAHDLYGPLKNPSLNGCLFRTFNDQIRMKPSMRVCHVWG